MENAINWAEIRRQWENGVTTAELSLRYDVEPGTIRTRASRQKWVAKAASQVVRTEVKERAKTVVSRVFNEKKHEIDLDIKREISACVKEACMASSELVRGVGRNAGRATDEADAGQLAQALRAGSEVWRTALGLANSPENVVNVGIKIGSDSTLESASSLNV